MLSQIDIKDSKGFRPRGLQKFLNATSTSRITLRQSTKTNRIAALRKVAQRYIPVDTIPCHIIRKGCRWPAFEYPVTRWTVPVGRAFAWTASTWTFAARSSASARFPKSSLPTALTIQASAPSAAAWHAKFAGAPPKYFACGKISKGLPPARQ